MGKSKEARVTSEPVEGCTFSSGEVISYDAMCGTGKIRIDGQKQSYGFHIVFWSSGRPSRPPVVGDRVSVKVRHKPSGESSIVDVYRVG